ncbi:hypothetical protein CPB83DRAFT_856253 [Crepidotus variabilis]|uniref:PIPK domain-containing protein n=1 Tax=Crepidotus variabilis TaxID=179855 RepID=A0A9P6EE96_9AGAR|nr:hypothetical protein CPB83DRAFT_856253 [Crepidotus variabilis]
MSTQKPLPELPKVLDLSVLSVEARNHRARLIQHFLSDLDEPTIESRRDGWTYVFEEVLDDLSRQLRRGDWLNAIKRGRDLKGAAAVRARAEAEKQIRPPNSRQGSSSGTEEDKENGEASDKSKDAKPLPDKPMPSVPPFQQLQTLASRPTPPQGEPRVSHLVLCLAPHGSRTAVPTEDSGFDVVPANIGCNFAPGAFSLRDPEEGEEGTILYGLDGLQVSLLDTHIRLVGGTFVLKGVNSPLHHQLLFKVLKLAIYTHLSLLLEQHALVDFGVRLKFPRPKLPPPSPSTPTRTSSNDAQKDKEVKLKTRNSIIPSSFTNFFARANLSYRGSQTTPSAGRGSLDHVFFPTSPEEPAAEAPSRKSADTPPEANFGARLRQFSFIGDRRYTFLRGYHNRGASQEQKALPAQPFNNALKRIEDSRSLLSASAGIMFTSPKVLVDLAQKEKERSEDPEKQRAMKLKGDERAALTSLLGWDGKDAEGRGMSGILGFVRQQEITFLYSAHVPSKPSSTKTASTSQVSTLTIANPQPSDHTQTSNFTNTTTDSTLTTATNASNLPAKALKACGKPHWVTYRYFSSESENDALLGDWIVNAVENRDKPCSSQASCTIPAGQHERRFIHDGLRIVVRVSDAILAEERVVLEEHKETDANDNAVNHSPSPTTGSPTTPAPTTPTSPTGISAPTPPSKDEPAVKPMKDHSAISIWESCAICNAKSKGRSMTTGTGLFSFAKYLELLVYSPSIITVTPMCEHTTPPPAPWTTLPTSRLNIIRHFSSTTADVTFSLSTIEDIFELRVPRLQIIRGADKQSPPPTSAGRPSESTPEILDQKKVLRKEIKKWWESVSDHIDKIENVLHSQESPERRQKVLPRLPSVDDAYDVFDDDTLESMVMSTTPTPSSPYPLPPIPPTTPHSPQSRANHNDSYFSTPSSVNTVDTDISATPTVPLNDNSDHLLASLRHNFQRIEQSLYAQLAKTPDNSLNDVRRAFLATGKGTKKRLKAWQDKHLGSSRSKTLGELIAVEPEWWGKTCYAVPGGNFIVRENDWGSIIAHTLSTVDYQREMVNLSSVRGSPPPTSPSPTTPVGTSSSFFSVATGYRLFTSSSKNQPDPDLENVVWNEPEQYSAIISRKEHSRDPTSLLSIHNVLRQKNMPEAPSNGVPPPSSASRFLTLATSSNAATVAPSTGNVTPVAAKSKPNVALNTEAAGGLLRGSDTVDKVDKLLQEIENESTPNPSRPPSRPPSIRSEALSTNGSGFIDTHIRRGKTSSIISTDSHESEATIHKEEGQILPKETLEETLVEKVADLQPEKPLQLTVAVPPSPPSKELPPVVEHDEKSLKPPESVQTMSTSTPLSTPPLPPPASSGFTNTIATSLNTAMRYVIGTEAPSPTSSSPSNANPKRHHGLLIADTSHIDERPHIKYDWTVGKRIRFSCTVYYARQFDILRKKCGIQDIFLKSLSKSANWAAEGGKSKSNFWMTNDDRFLIKTLVNAWNVADLQILIDHAPSYFRYIDATAGKPTVLAKLVGFYTIEVKNLETGAIQSKADLLVMENLFYNRHITKTFDLKGIQGRKVKTHGTATKTFFDGEWIEGQQKTLTLVRPHSKVILREAIKNDADFLAKSNIMDYSLLLGVDEDKKEIACGLVDTIGSYTFAKTIEYKAKLGLQSGNKEVTVIPPAEYQERFVNTLEGYFLACPDKWSKPLDDSKIISDPNSLPSIL